MTILSFVLATSIGLTRDEIPGLYYTGDGLGRNLYLELSKDGGYKYRWCGCLGEYDRSNGRWSLEGDLLVLRPSKKPNNQMNVRFVPVKWGTRISLVDEYEMPGFAASAHESTDVSGRPLDYAKILGQGFGTVDGAAPQLPERYRVFFDLGPVEVRVLKIEGNKATLDLGAASNVPPGTRFVTRAMNCEVELARLDASESTGIIRYTAGADEPLKVGDKLSSGGVWRRPRGSGCRRYDSLTKAKAAKE